MSLQKISGKFLTFSLILYQVTPYAHGDSELLAVQIDAAINPGVELYSVFCKVTCFMAYKHIPNVTNLW
jgi:hypothetical protein